MMTRSAQSSVTGRASAMRRMRRRTSVAAGRMYCSTNGCTSFLEIEPETGTARCPICGFVRRVH